MEEVINIIIDQVLNKINLSTFPELSSLKKKLTLPEIHLYSILINSDEKRRFYA